MISTRYKIGTIRERIFWYTYTGFRAGGHSQSKALRLAKKLSGINYM